MGKFISFFGSGLYLIKEEKSWTLQELSATVGLSASYLSEIINGVKSPDEIIMRKVGDALGILPESIIARGRILHESSQELLISQFTPLLSQLSDQLNGSDDTGGQRLPDSEGNPDWISDKGVFHVV